MDIAGTKKKVQRLIKVAEESYKKISELLERMERLQNDLETTSRQVDHMEYELAEQRVLLEALAEQRGVDVETVLAEADLPPEPRTDLAAESEKTATEQATSRPSADTSSE
jgi:DNA anti-recombination protein RmuC